MVGDGASGRDIALECRPMRPVMLACGKPRKLFPEQLFGKSIWWWLRLLGILKASPTSWIGRKVRAADAFPDRGQADRDLLSAGVQLVKRLVACSGATATFSDGGSGSVRTIVWATGYRDETDWLNIRSQKDGMARSRTPAGFRLYPVSISSVGRGSGTVRLPLSWVRGQMPNVSSMRFFFGKIVKDKNNEAFSSTAS